VCLVEDGTLKGTKLYHRHLFKDRREALAFLLKVQKRVYKKGPEALDLSYWWWKPNPASNVEAFHNETAPITEERGVTLVDDLVKFLSSRFSWDFSPVAECITFTKQGTDYLIERSGGKYLLLRLPDEYLCAATYSVQALADLIDEV
jgi:hypothetical protein